MGKNQILDLSKVIATPLLTGKNDTYIWTGFVRAKNITPYMIADDEKREKFVALVKAYEDSIIQCRQYNKQHKEAPNLEASSLIISMGFNLKMLLQDPNIDWINKELFAIQLYREYEEILQNAPEEVEMMSPDMKDSLKALKNFITSEPIPVIDMFSKSENKYYFKDFPIQEQERKFEKRKSENINGLTELIKSIAEKDDIDEKYGEELLKELVCGIKIEDLLFIFPEEYIRYGAMETHTMLKNYLLRIGFTPKQIEEKTKDDESRERTIDETVEKYNSESLETHATYIRDGVVNNISRIDIQKLLLMSAKKIMEIFDTMQNASVLPVNIADTPESVDEREQEGKIMHKTTFADVIQFSKRAEYIVRKILDSNIISPRTKLKIDTGKELLEVITLGKIKELTRNFCDGIYLSKPMQKNLMYSAYLSEDEMSRWSDELVQRMNYSEQDLRILSAINFENLERLYRLGKMDKSKVEDLLSRITSGKFEKDLARIYDDEESNPKSKILGNAKNLLRNLLDSKIIEENDLKKYFAEGIIDFEMLKTLEEGKEPNEIEELHAKLKDICDQEMLLQRYKQYAEKYIEFIKFQTEHPEKISEIEKMREELNHLRAEKEKYREVFCYYNDVSENTRHTIGEELLEKYYVEMGVEDDTIMQVTMDALYEDGMIDLENIVQFDSSFIIPMLDKLSLQDIGNIRKGMVPEQVKKLINTVFADPAFTDERKYILVMNLLSEDTKEDEKLRAMYLSLLDFDTTSGTRNVAQGNRRRKPKVPPTTNKANKNVYPDNVKWKFFNALDKDAKVKRYANGYVEFASSKLGVRIIEKYYDGNDPAYGVATFIMPEAIYRRNVGNLATITPKGEILESYNLGTLVPRYDRIVHRTKSVDRTWMDDMLRYFNIDLQRGYDSRYTPEEFEKLMETVTTYKGKYGEIVKNGQNVNDSRYTQEELNQLKEAIRKIEPRTPDED